MRLETASITMQDDETHGELTLNFRYQTRIVPFELGKEVSALLDDSKCLIYTEMGKDNRFRLRIRVEDSSLETRTWASLEGDHLYSSTIVKGESLLQYAGSIEGELETSK
ncbi:MAG: hypothetical protein LKF79_07495 [Solobacterium sp.]|nr:hypothetical protein [Solobacterium sp.]MCH4266471.1 hypothetical protein [Solobacterium sp.]